MKNLLKKIFGEWELYKSEIKVVYDEDFHRYYDIYRKKRFNGMYKYKKVEII